MPTSQVYPNAPLATAVLELRHPSRNLSQGDLAALQGRLRHLTPMMKDEEIEDRAIQLGPTGAFSSSGTRRTLHRFLTRDRQSSATFDTANFTLETTAYRGWNWFRDAAQLALTAAQEIAPVPGIERIGLRSINEIRPPDPSDWALWIDPSLLAPAFGMSVLQHQSAVLYGLGRPGYAAALRYGAHDGPPIVSGGPNIVRANTPSPGRYFVLDIDASWSVPDGDDVPEMTADDILHIADELHATLKGVFEASITDRLREEFERVD